MTTERGLFERGEGNMLRQRAKDFEVAFSRLRGRDRELGLNQREVDDLFFLLRAAMESEASRPNMEAREHKLREEISCRIAQAKAAREQHEQEIAERDSKIARLSALVGALGGDAPLFDPDDPAACKVLVRRKVERECSLCGGSRLVPGTFVGCYRCGEVVLTGGHPHIVGSGKESFEEEVYV